MEENKVINSNFLQPRDAWDRLSLAEKAEMMKVAVNNGIFNLQDIRNKYNEFAEGGDTDSDEANTISLNEAKRMGVMVGLAPFTRQKGYIGGSPSEARDKYWQTDKEMRVLTDSVAGRYGISPDLLRSRMDQEGYTDSRIAEINHDAQKGTNRALLGEALFHSQAMPYVAGEEFGLDDVATYINDGTVKLINEKWGDGQGQNEKGRWTNLAMGYDYSDNVGIMAATLKAMRELARKDFPKASEADLDRYAQAYYNRGITGGRKWVQSGAKGYKINKHSIGGPLVDAAMNEYKKGGGIHIKPSHRGRLTELKKRTGKSEAELYRTGSPATRKMITFARNARKWKHGLGGNLFGEGGEEISAFTPIENPVIPKVEGDQEAVNWLANWYNNRREQMYNNLKDYDWWQTAKYDTKDFITGNPVGRRAINHDYYNKLNNMARYKTATFDDLYEDNPASYEEQKDNAFGYTVPDTHKIYYDEGLMLEGTKHQNKQEGYSPMGVRIHERTHASGETGDNGLYTGYNVQTDAIEDILRLKKGVDFDWKWDVSPEIYGRMMEFRYNHNMDPKKKYTKEEIQMMLDQESKGFKSELQRYDLDTLTRALNEVAQINTPSWIGMDNINYT